MYRSLAASLAGVSLTGVVLFPVAPAQAAATVIRFSETHTTTFTGPLEGCLPDDLVGRATLSETTTGQVVETDSGVFAVHGVVDFDVHIVFPDGTFVQSGLNRDRFVFVFESPHTVFNVVTQDFRTIYAADGTPIGTLTIHGGSHITFNDANGNDEPDPGEVTVEFNHFRLRCR